MKFESKYQGFFWRNCIWKWLLQNDGHFVRPQCVKSLNEYTHQCNRSSLIQTMVWCHYATDYDLWSITQWGNNCGCVWITYKYICQDKAYGCVIYKMATIFVRLMSGLAMVVGWFTAITHVIPLWKWDSGRFFKTPNVKPLAQCSQINLIPRF